MRSMLAGAALVGLLLAGCGDPSTPEPEDSGGTGTATSPTPPSGQATVWRGGQEPDCSTEREQPTSTRGPHGDYRTPDWSRETVRYELNGTDYDVVLPLPVSPAVNASAWTSSLQLDGPGEADLEEGLRLAGTGAVVATACVVRTDNGSCCAESYLDRSWEPGKADRAELVVEGANVTIRADYEARSHHCAAWDSWNFTGGQGHWEVPVDGRMVCS